MGIEDDKEIERIFSGSFLYTIPQYQRDYDWKKQQIKEFWDDIIDFYDNSSEKTYFLGPIVLVKVPNEKSMNIVDGQQRFTTIQILITVIRDILMENGDISRSETLNSYIFTRGDNFPFLTLNQNNNEYFRELIFDRSSKPMEKIAKKPSETQHSKIRIHDNYKILYNSIKQRFLKGQTIENQNDNIYKFFQKIKYGLTFFEITLDSNEKAFRLFATLNNRGLKLRLSDLIKSMIFLKTNTSPENHNSFNTTWEMIRKNLPDPNKFDEFLRHSYIAKYGFVTAQSLYSSVEKNVGNVEQVRKYLDELRVDSTIYHEIVNSQRDDTTGFYLKTLFNELNNDSAQPVILNAKKKWNKNQKNIDEITKICFNVFVRGKTIGGKPASVVGKNFAAAAQSILLDKSFEEVINELKGIDIPDESFRSTIQEAQFQELSAKVILKTIERFYDSQPGKENKAILSTITLEHILPQTIVNKDGTVTDWAKEGSESYFTESEHREYCNRIGNLTLLNKVKNSELKNLSFKEKVKKYKTEKEINLTKGLEEVERWTKEIIDQRSKTLSDMAKDIFETILSKSESKELSEKSDKDDTEIEISDEIENE